MYDKPFNVESLKQNLKSELENKFGVEFGITATWLNCGSPSNNPLENVLFFKKPCDNKPIILDDKQYHFLYPMNE